MGLTGYAGIPGDAKAEIGRPDYGAAQNQPVQISQITRAAERHAKALAYLDDRLNVFHNRLTPVLRPSQPRPSDANKAEQSKPIPVAPFAEALNQVSSVLERIGSDVEDMLNRLEL